MFSTNKVFRVTIEGRAMPMVHLWLASLLLVADYISYGIYELLFTMIYRSEELSQKKKLIKAGHVHIRGIARGPSKARVVT
jgi:hypothetical protein